MTGHGHAGRPGHGPATVLGALLVLVWFATPVLLYGAMVTQAAFFGEPPTAQDRATATRLLVLAGLTGILAPALAALTAPGRGLRVVALLELGLSLLAVLVLATTTG